jgi:hypothetical protein
MEIIVNDRLQSGYSYRREAPVAADFAATFTPYYTPPQMLEMGVFEGKYLNDCQPELPADWFVKARLSVVPDVEMNYFGIKSRQSLSVWQQNGWIYGPDPRGWFQWYCRYYLGRRLPDTDTIQIKRWRAFTRHAGQVRANCHPGDVFCRPRQRQALLQWAHDALI